MGEIVTKACLFCGAKFSYERGIKGKRTATCSEECRISRRADKQKAFQGRYRAEGRYRERERAHWRVIICERNCLICDQPFPVRKANPKTETCSVRCGNTLGARRAIEAGTHKGFVNNPKIYPDRRTAILHMNIKRRQRKKQYPELIELVVPRRIFERDGWKCGLCGRKVDKRLKWPHPRSASLDHIIALADGGPHTTQNSQCSHLECNWRKNAGAGGQLRLFG